MLMWFYYLTFLENARLAKNKLQFFVLPFKKYIFTSVKAPMAHKNWSKEQYQKSFFKIVISFSSTLNSTEVDSTTGLVLTTNAALLLLLTTKRKFPTFETNILFLKSFRFFFFFTDPAYFNFYNFLKAR